MRRRVRRALLVVFLLAVASGIFVAVSIALVGPTVWRASDDGQTALREASAAVVRRDGPAARVEFEAARNLFDQAEGRLDSSFALPLRIAPIISRHVGVAESLTTIGHRIADAGVEVTKAIDSLPKDGLAFKNGAVDLRQVKVAQRALAASVAGIPAIEEAITSMPGRWVASPLAGPRRQAVEVLPSILDGVRKAEAALAGLPSILAEGGTKRYLVAFSNLSELRGSGGLFGFVTALTARNGDLDLDELSGRPTEIFPAPGDVGLDYPSWFPDDFRQQAKIFQNINMTTDFPTVGGFVLKTAQAEAGGLDGVIAVDPIGIGGILKLTGPVRVPSWPIPITAENVAKIAMHDIYVEFPSNSARDVFFGQLVRGSFERLVSSTIRLTPDSVGSFDTAVAGGHFRMFSKHGPDQSVFDRIGASGAVARAADANDVLSVVSENATGNKGDWYLRRDIAYEVFLDPDRARASTHLRVTFRNTAPSTGLPDYVIGSPLEGLPKGANQQILSIVRASTDEQQSFRIDDRDAGAFPEREGDLRAYRSSILVPARARSTIDARSTVPDAFFGRGNERVFRLHILPQAVANPDFAEVEVHVPKGWTAVGETRFLGDLTRDVVLEVRLTRTVRGSIVQTVFTDPLRLAGDLLGRLF